VKLHLLWCSSTAAMIMYKKNSWSMLENHLGSSSRAAALQKNDQNMKPTNKNWWMKKKKNSCVMSYIHGNKSIFACIQVSESWFVVVIAAFWRWFQARNGWYFGWQIEAVKSPSFHSGVVLAPGADGQLAPWLDFAILSTMGCCWHITALALTCSWLAPVV
jgi:hypothetical protein